MLQVFRALPTVVEVHRADALPARAAAYARDTMALGWEERLRARGRRKADGGTEFGTSLPRGTVLMDGDALVVDALSLVVTVIASEESVLVVRPATFAEWGLYGYHIGNSHQPLMLTADAIVCPDVPGMDQVLDQHGIPYAREARAFTPVSSMGDADHRHGG